MNENTFIKIINERNQLRNDLNKNMNKSSFYKGEGCYLIEESWDSELNNNFHSYDDDYEDGIMYESDEDYNYNGLDYNQFIPKEKPIFINNIESIIKCIKNKTKLKLVNQKLIKLIYGKDKLKDCKLIKYYVGNKKLIIEYMNDEDNKAILFLNPLNQDKIEERTFIISTEDLEDIQKIEIFENLLTKNKYFSNYVMLFKTYLKYNELIIKKNIIEKEELKNEGCLKLKGNLEPEKINLNNKKELQNESNLIEELINENDNLKNKIEELKKIIKEKEKKINEYSERYKKMEAQYLRINEKQKLYRENLEKELNEYKEKEKLLKINDEIKEGKINKIIIEKDLQKLIKSDSNIYKKDMMNKDLTKLEKELKEKEEMIKEKEKEINKKIAFLEDKENIIEKENNENKKRKLQYQKDIGENIKLKKENKNLIKRNEELEKEIKKKESQLKLYCGKEKAIEGYTVPTLIGLNNIGATCFMNSTLQCLSQTYHLTKYFLNKNNEKRIKNNNFALKDKKSVQLSPIYLDLIKKLWNKNESKSFSPQKFMNVIEKMNPLFKQGQAGDSKDFIIFILEQLHKELKSPIDSNNYINSNEPFNQYDKANAINHFINDFKNECSIISDVFFGFTETTNECLYCKNVYNSKGLQHPICYNYGIFNCIIFPLEEVKNLRNNYIQNNNFYFNQNNVVSIYDCFCYNLKSEIFTGDNQNYCNICKQKFDSIYSSKIFSSPIILVLILNRGKDNKYNIKLNFFETIDITSFVLQRDKPNMIYNLYGVITHIGESGPNAHFVASCKSPIDNKWYRYNDAFVSPIINIEKEVIEFGTPYILFYQKNE